MILTALCLFSQFSTAFSYQHVDDAGFVQVNLASGSADPHDKPASLIGVESATRLRVNVEDYCLDGECKTFADHIENRCIKEAPIGRLDMIECFTNVMASHKGTPLEVDYFLYYGTNLAAARGGELMPYDHDIDVLITEEANTTFKFEKIWRDKALLKGYYSKFPACERSALALEVQTINWNGNERLEAFHVLYGDHDLGLNKVSHEQILEPSDRAVAVRMHGLVSTIDTWRVPYNQSTSAQLCHWGWCMNPSDIYPLKECSLKDSRTEPNRIVKTQCMHDPAAGAGFYSQADSANHFRTADWHQPLFNLWNDQTQEWEWDEEIWKMHEEGKADMFVYDKAEALLAAHTHAHDHKHKHARRSVHAKPRKHIHATPYVG